MSDTSVKEPQTETDHIPGAVDQIDKVPEPLRRFYTHDEESGKYIARINGHYVPAETVKKFRETNIDVMKRLSVAEAVAEEASTIFKNLGGDPKAIEAEVLEARKLKQRLSDNELVDKKGWETALAQRTEQMKQTLEGQIVALKEQVNLHKDAAEKVAAENKRIVVSGEITRAAVAAGVLPDAIPDLLARADRSGWTRTDKGEVALIDSKTNTFVYGANGVDYITPEEWVASLKQSARHFFNIPFGGGATGSDNGLGGKNPWSKDAWDDMAQAAAYRADPVKAEQMAKSAGSYIGALRPA